MEMQIAEQLLSKLVALMPQLTMVEQHDQPMQGKLDLTLHLIRVLGSRGLASTDSHHLVHLLFTGKLPACFSFCFFRVCMPTEYDPRALHFRLLELST